jgi:hypothetical protein
MLGVELNGRPTRPASFPKSDFIARIGLSDVDVSAVPLAGHCWFGEKQK